LIEKAPLHISPFSHTVRAVFRQEHETALVSAYLPEKGFFVEVGAFQPQYLSQTWQLEEAGWDGLLVEPIPEHAEALRRNRRARVYEVACGSPEQHGTTSPINVRGGLSSFGSGEGAGLDVRVVTLDWVLADAKVPKVDFLSIDVEGWEIEVLRGFSFSQYRPKLILLEDFAEGQGRHRYMVAAGYKRVRRTGDNSWYVPREVPFRVSLFGRWQLLRKYSLSAPFRSMKRLLRG
jgi:FkbM family methyltransferase